MTEKHVWDVDTDDPPAQHHSETSVAAAEEVKPSAARMRQQVLAAIEASPDGLTDQECQTLLRMDPSTQRPRRIELVKKGGVRDSGRKRLTRANRHAVVWERVPGWTPARALLEVTVG